MPNKSKSSGKPNSSGKPKTSYAGGGVLWQLGEHGQLQIAVVHRPEYDDWTLPKGKQHLGETLLTTAVREIAEETGYRVILGRHLRTVQYPVNGHPKLVAYWAARATGGEFLPNSEVDELRWLDIADAHGLLTYPNDRGILAEFTKYPADRLHTMLLVRHANAGRRSTYSGDDRLRPLDESGRRQAAALVDILVDFGVTRLSAADRVRCVQTLEPAARRLRVAIGTEPQLSEEAYKADRGAAQRRIRQVAADTADVHALCSQGAVIPPLMDWWSERDAVDLPRSNNRKGSIWVLSLLDGTLVTADHIASPLPTDTPLEPPD